MPERCFDFRGEHCPVLLNRIIAALEACPTKTRVTIHFDDPGMAARLPRFLPLYGASLLEMSKVTTSGWRAIVRKTH